MTPNASIGLTPARHNQCRRRVWRVLSTLIATTAEQIDPDSAHICNCTDCQMLTGSAFRVSVHAAIGADLRLCGRKISVRCPQETRSENVARIAVTALFPNQSGQ